MMFSRKLSLLATCIYIALSSTQQAYAACTDYQPGSGQAVQCDASTPNPTPTAVISADGATGVTVDIAQDSQLTIVNGPALSLGDDSRISNAGQLIGSTSGVILREGSTVLTNSGTITGTAGAGVLFRGNGNNSLNNSGTIQGSGGNTVIFGAGNDTLLITDGTITGDIDQGDGADKTEIRGGVISGTLQQGNGIDDFLMSGGTLGALQQGDNRDTFTMTGGTITGAFEDGDVAKMTGGTIGRVNMKLDNNIFDMSGGEIIGNLVTGFGNDTILISGDSVIGGNISVSGGTDSVTVTGGTVKGDIRMSTGNDTFHWENGGIIQGAIQMEGDNDRIELKDLPADITASSPTIDGGVGDDTMDMDNSQYVHSTANLLQGIEHITLNNGSVLTLKDDVLALGDARDDNADTGYNIDATSTLAVQNTQAVAFSGHLSGNGTVSTNTSGSAFDFTENNVDDNFAGTLAVGDSTLLLSGLNTQALNNATLRADTDSIITVGDGEQRIGGLAFNGGAVDFGSVAPGNTLSDNTIQTSRTLDLSGSGTVVLGVNNLVNTYPTPENNLPLLSQDDANTTIKLAGTDGTITGSGGSLTLKDNQGNTITDSITDNILQDDAVVAEGTWDWRLTSGEKQDGLYVGYALTQVDLQGTGDSALRLNSQGASGNEADLSAKVTGSGDLAIENPAGGDVSLSNQENDYTGITDVRSGNLLMKNNNVLGNTSLLSLASDTSLEMNGYAQKVGQVDTAENSLISLSGGSLTLEQGGTVNGHLSGEGALTLNGGTLDINGANIALSATTTLLSDATVNLNDTQGLGSGGIDNAGQININNANGTFSNSLSNGGAVSLNTSQVVLAGDNSAFSGTFNIDKDSQLTAAEAAHLGSAAVNDAGTLALVTQNDWVLNNSVTGDGGLNKDGAGFVTLTNASAAYTGITNVNQGGIGFGTRSLPVNMASSLINISEGAVLEGNGGVSGDINNKGTLQVGRSTDVQNAVAPAVMPVAIAAADTLTVGGNLTNSGHIQLGQTAGTVQPGNTLTVNGDYTGDGGDIAFNTALGDDSSATDLMKILGNTSGTTSVSVTNVGGSGARTLNGIEIIDVAGMSAGEFTQAGRIAAGAYDYRLTRGAGANNANWYLTNDADEPINPTEPTDPTTPADPGEPTTPVNPTEPGNPGEPVPPVNPTEPGNPGEPVPPVNPVEPGNSGEPATPGEPETPAIPNEPSPPARAMLRPESGSYIANTAAANTMFVTRLHDRLGETQYTDALTGEKRVTSLWLRQVGTHNAWRDSSGSLKTTSNQYVVMLGGDIAQWSHDGLDRGHLGIMGGYGNNQSHTHSSLTGYTSKGEVDGYNVGVYGTWYANDTDKTGVYVDSWAQYGWFKNHVNGEDLAGESYDSKGVTASLESGYTWKVGDFSGSKQMLNSVYIQPQAQATWMGIKADNHTDRGGTRVRNDGDGNVQTRLGVRTFIKGHSQLDAAKDRDFEPFVEVNWLHNTRTYGVKMNDVRVSQDGARNIGEVKTGVEGQFSRNVTGWGNVGQQVGDKGYNNTQAMIGIKYSW